MNNEEWRGIPGYEGYYQVSNQGRVRGLDRVVPHSLKGRISCKGRLLCPGKSRKGYLFVALKKYNTSRTRSVHTLVALVFVGPRPAGHDVHHINGNRTDNRDENLCYVDARKHVAEHMRGNDKGKGSKHGQTKLDEAKVLRIKELLFAGQYKPRQIAEMYGVSREAIVGIKHGRNWRHVELPSDGGEP